MSDTGNVIACRPGCYDLPLKDALEELSGLGVHYAEVPPPADGDYAALADMAKGAGVAISSFGTGCCLEDPEQVAALARCIEGAGAIGTRIIFLSAAMGAGAPEDGIPVLRELAGKAHAAGVTVSIETHEPFGHNGETARRTIEAVGVPGIGHNFDTANVYYYNPKGVDAVEELKKVLPYVVSVHLKESARGEPLSFDFPALGEGIVDFPEVFRLLGERGFRGPYTMELEGPLVDGLPTDERSARIKVCLDYLARIGAA